MTSHVLLRRGLWDEEEEKRKKEKDGFPGLPSLPRQFFPIDLIYWVTETKISVCEGCEGCTVRKSGPEWHLVCGRGWGVCGVCTVGSVSEVHKLSEPVGSFSEIH